MLYKSRVGSTAPHGHPGMTFTPEGQYIHQQTELQGYQEAPHDFMSWTYCHSDGLGFKSQHSVHRLLEVINTLRSSCTNVFSNWMWPQTPFLMSAFTETEQIFLVVFWCVSVTRRHSDPEIHGTQHFWQGGLIIGFDCWLTFLKNLFGSLWPFSDPS